MNAIIRKNDKQVDELEAVMMEAALSENDDISLADCPLNHYFIPNEYVREIIMNEGILITSKVHKTTHPFRILQGKVAVKIDENDWQIFEGEYSGITQAGTRRVLYILENTVWRTYHVLPFITGDENELAEDELNELLEKIENTILEPYDNELLGGILTRNQIKQPIKIEVQ